MEVVVEWKLSLCGSGRGSEVVNSPINMYIKVMIIDEDKIR